LRRRRRVEEKIGGGEGGWKRRFVEEKADRRIWLVEKACSCERD
jgi:spermidine synthase